MPSYRYETPALIRKLIGPKNLTHWVTKMAFNHKLSEFFKTIVSALVLLLLSESSFAVILPMKADGYLGSRYYLTGSSSPLLLSSVYFPLMAFDMSVLPVGVRSSDIEKATLVYYVNQLTKPGSVIIYPVLTSWDESNVGRLTVGFDLDSITSPIVSRAMTFNTVDVTHLVADWVDDPGSNLGLIIKPNPANATSLSILSKESNGSYSGRSAYIDVILKGPIFNYKIGDTGPGGGIIFFVDRYDEYPGFTYLEAAPTPQPKSTWCDVNTAINIGAVGMAGSIGSGQVNTTNMVNACQSGAGNIADNYSTPTASDWYLPSFQEMVLLMSSARNLGFYEMDWSVLDAAFFWTSTAITLDSGVIGNFRSVFVVNANTKQTTQFSWPIRSF